MAKREILYQRQLRRPLDDAAKQAIESEFLRRRDEIPIATEFRWHAVDPEFTIKSSWASLIVRFTEETLVVQAELSLAARMLVTDAHRQRVVQFIDSMVNDLGL